MKNEKRKRGRPPKIFTAETTGMTYEGTINYALDRQLKSETRLLQTSPTASLQTRNASTLTAVGRTRHERSIFALPRASIRTLRTSVSSTATRRSRSMFETA